MALTVTSNKADLDALLVELNDVVSKINSFQMTCSVAVAPDGEVEDTQPVEPETPPADGTTDGTEPTA